MKSLRKWFILPIVSSMLFSCAIGRQLNENEAKGIASKILASRIYNDDDSRAKAVGTVKLSGKDGEVESSTTISVDVPKGYGHFQSTQSENGTVSESEQWCWVEEDESGAKTYWLADSHDGKTITATGENSHAAFLGSIASFVLGYIDAAYTVLTYLTGEAEPMYEMKFSNFYSTGSGQLDFDVDTSTTISAVSFSKNAPVRINSTTLADSSLGQSVSVLRITFSYSSPTITHPAMPEE